MHKDNVHVNMTLRNWILGNYYNRLFVRFFRFKEFVFISLTLRKVLGIANMTLCNRILDNYYNSRLFVPFFWFKEFFFISLTVRKVLGIVNRDRISNWRLQEIAEEENLTQRVACTKWSWGGHVARQQGRWAQSTTMWDPYIGDRSRGRPRKRWADFFKQHVRVHGLASLAIGKSGRN